MALFRTYCKSSAVNTNKRGDRGSPCLTPLLHWNYFPGTPFNKTEELAVDNITDTHLIQSFRKPIANIMSAMVVCSTVSKAFEKSSFKIMISLLVW